MRWKRIPNTNYSVSDTGSVRNDNTLHILKPQDNGKGYMGVILLINGKPTYKYVHRLVAAAFVENPKGYPDVNHKDENKLNNHYTNLEWCTKAYNIEYSRGKPVAQIKDGKVIAVYASAASAARQLGKSNSRAIRGCCLGEWPTAYGYQWKYLEKEDYNDTHQNS
jgi:hypothetical protein